MEWIDANRIAPPKGKDLLVVVETDKVRDSFIGAQRPHGTWMVYGFNLVVGNEYITHWQYLPELP